MAQLLYRKTEKKTMVLLHRLSMKVFRKGHIKVIITVHSPLIWSTNVLVIIMLDELI